MEAVAAFYTKLLENVVKMNFDGAWAQSQFTSYFLV
jgi:hypothetical protein